MGGGSYSEISEKVNYIFGGLYEEKTLIFLCAALSAVMFLAGCQGVVDNLTNLGNDLTDKPAVAAAKAALELPQTEIKSPDDLELPKISNGIKITWKSNKPDVIANCLLKRHPEPEKRSHIDERSQ